VLVVLNKSRSPASCNTICAAHSSERLCPQLGQSLLAFQREGADRSPLDGQSGFRQGKRRNPKCPSPQGAKYRRLGARHVRLHGRQAGTALDELLFLAPPGAELLIDALLFYEPADARRV